MISNINQFIEYIENQLGKPAINIEIPDGFIKVVLSDILTENNFNKSCYELIFINDNAIERLTLKYEDDRDTFILNHPDIKKLVIAKCLKYWSRILGKYEMIINDDSKVNWKFLWDQGVELEKSVKLI